jgi:hypothetical protein
MNILTYGVSYNAQKDILSYPFVRMILFIWQYGIGQNDIFLDIFWIKFGSYPFKCDTLCGIVIDIMVQNMS